MNIGIDVSPAVYGTGVADYLVNLIGHLPAKELTIFGSSLRRQSDLRRLFPTSRILPFPPTFLGVLWNRLHVLPIERFIGRVDVFHSSDWLEPPAGCPKVTTVHDLSPFLYPGEVSPQIVSVHRAKMRWAVKECSKFICVSTNTAADLQRLFKVESSKIAVIKEALPARFQIQPRVVGEPDYLVAIGARQPRKNVSRLISAYLRYEDKLRLPAKLVIIGEAPSNQVTTNQVTYTGYLPDQDLVDYLAGAAAFVYPSLYEGFGLPILVAFYHQVPVAAANTSSIPEVAGDAAVLFDPYSEEAIAQAVVAAINNRDRLIAAGTKQLSKFSWAKAAQETLAVYKSLC